MKDTKPEIKAKKTQERNPIQLMKVHFPDGVVVEVSAPYCTREEWAERTGMDEDVVKLALYNRQMARHKFSPKGDLFVNVIEEVRRLFDVQPWNR